MAKKKKLLLLPRPPKLLLRHPPRLLKLLLPLPLLLLKALLRPLLLRLKLHLLKRSNSSSKLKAGHGRLFLFPSWDSIAEKGCHPPDCLFQPVA